MIGNIKAMNSKGFGFITDKDGIDYFFHYTDTNATWKLLIQDWIRASKKIEVEFDVDETSSNGPKAKNVRIVDVIR